MRNAKYAVLPLVFILLVGQWACTQNQIVTSIQTVIMVGQAALPIIAGATGLPASTVQMIANYMGAVSAALQAGLNIASKGGTKAQVAAQIVSACAGIAQPVLPTGTPSNVATAVANFANSVNDLLRQLQTPQAARSPQKLKITQKELDELTKKNADWAAEIIKLKGKR